MVHPPDNLSRTFARKRSQQNAQLKDIYRLFKVFIASAEAEANQVRNTTKPTGGQNGLSPRQRLEPPNWRLIEPGIATIKDMETLRVCVGYENAHQNRIQILRRLHEQANEIRSP